MRWAMTMAHISAHSDCSPPTGYNTIKQALHVDQDKLNTRFRRGELFQRVSVQRLKQLLEGGCVDMLLLDLREEDDFERWHLRGGEVETATGYYEHMQ